MPPLVLGFLSFALFLCLCLERPTQQNVSDSPYTFPADGMSHFSKKTLVPFLWKMVFRRQNLSTGYAFCSWGISTSRLL